MKIMGIVAAVVTLVSTIASAGVQPVLKNNDSKSYKYEITCAGGSSTSSSIDANAQITLSLPGMSGCKLKVAGAGSSKVGDGTRCVIKDSSLDCN